MPLVSPHHLCRTTFLAVIYIHLRMPNKMPRNNIQALGHHICLTLHHRLGPPATSTQHPIHHTNLNSPQLPIQDQLPLIPLRPLTNLQSSLSKNRLYQTGILCIMHQLHHGVKCMLNTSMKSVTLVKFDNAPPERYLMITEVDRYGIHRNRQPEYFFNGIIGHIRACRNGWIDSWTQANLLSNYWRRHYQIPKVHQHPSSTWWNFEDTHNASLQNVPDMEDTDSIHAQVENSPPVQIHQLATLFWNILNTDRDGNRGILERLEDTDEDLSRHPVQIFGPEDLAHLASHLAATTQTLADQAHAMAAMTDLSD